MGFKTVFSRYEYKYIITHEQKGRILQVMAPYMKGDQYGKSTLRNLYFDTPNFLLIRRSIEKPLYKEKLRLRSYQTATKDSTVFVELKKKFKKVVYKRRLALPEEEAMNWLIHRIPPKEQSQIFKEIDYALNLYGTLQPTVYLSYDREAFFGKQDGEFRVTFDENIRCRTHNLSLQAPPDGEYVLPPDKLIMEIKCAGGIPLWMVQALSQEKLYKNSFSKYGTAYKSMIFPKLNQKETVSHDLSRLV